MFIKTLDNNKTTSNINISFHRLVLLLFLILEWNADLRKTQVIWFGVIGLNIISLFINIVNKQLDLRNAYFKWVSVFLGYLITTLIWTINIEYSLDLLINWFIYLVIFINISIMLRSSEDIYFVLKLFILATCINIVYILSIADLSVIMTENLGKYSLSNAWNSNNIGKITAFSSFMAMILYGHEKKKRLVYFLVAVMCITITIMTGSRQSIIIILLFALYYAFRTTNKIILRLLIITTVIIAGFYMFINIPSLYNLIGYRINRLIQFAFNDNYVDTSLSERQNMINIGLEWFKTNPVFGYGVNTFKQLYGMYYGRYMLGHCNYVDMLVGVGIIGVVIYYSSYFIILKDKLRNNKNDFNFIKFLIISFFIIEIASMSYYIFVYQLILCLGFNAARIIKEEDKLIA